MQRRISNVLVAFALILLCLQLIHVTAASPSLSYVYSLDDKGLARITVIVSGLTGILEYSFPVYEQVVNESLIAFDENGDIVLADYNGTHIIIYPYNTTDKVIVQFDAITGVIENNIIIVTIHPYGPATITLPDNAGLLYFNDTPEIEIIGNTIKLYFNESAGYEIQYIVVNETTQTTTTTTSTTTTSPTTTTPSTTTTTTTQVTTPTTTTTTHTPTTTQTATITTTTTTIPNTTTTTGTTTTGTVVTTTQTSTPTFTKTTTPTMPTGPTTQTSPQSSKTTSSKPPTYTPVNTTTTGSSTTTTTGGEAGFPTIVVVFIVIIIVLLILGYILFKMRFGKSGESGQQTTSKGGGGSGELVIEEPGAIDERDKLILEKIASKSMTISELARETGLSKSTVWRRIRKLEKEGYVKTRGEGKYTYIEITDKGRSALGKT